MGRRLTRRQLLKGAAGVAVAAAVPAWLARGVLPIGGDGKKAATTPKRLRQWAWVADLRKCDGCVSINAPPACMEACNATHFVPQGQAWIRVFQVEEPGGSYFLPRPCMHCENAPCTNVCPVGATYHNEEGIVLQDNDRCIGCRLCIAACPYGARSFNWEQPENPAGATFAHYSPEYAVPHRRGTVEKCMLCAHRTRDGKLPACVQACPMNALYLGDLVEDVAANKVEVVKLSRFLSENNAFRLKEELGTRPRVWYIPGHGQDYGRHADDRRPILPARTWQEQGATLTEEEAILEGH